MFSLLWEVATVPTESSAVPRGQWNHHVVLCLKLLAEELYVLCETIRQAQTLASSIHVPASALLGTKHYSEDHQENGSEVAKCRKGKQTSGWGNIIDKMLMLHTYGHCSLISYPQWPKGRSNPSAHGWWTDKWYVVHCIQWNMTQP